MTVELGVQEENQRPACISTHYLMTVELGVQEENQQPACISTHYLHNIKLYQVVYLTKGNIKLTRFSGEQH
jgi:aromatic ring-opening dioxygenase catalytic subunit (LigB family)